MTIGGTASYEGVTDLPPLVKRAVSAARDAGFDLSCRPEQGRLLQLLAAGRRGGSIGETGSGCGVGLAWLASGADRQTRIVSVERDEGRAEVARGVLRDQPHVTVLHADWEELLVHGPFDLLVLDGGGSGKADDDKPVDPLRALVMFGTVVIDDFTPLREWPPRHDGQVDVARQRWLQHPNLLSTEIILCSQMSTIVGTRVR